MKIKISLRMEMTIDTQEKTDETEEWMEIYDTTNMYRESKFILLVVNRTGEIINKTVKQGNKQEELEKSVRRGIRWMRKNVLCNPEDGHNFRRFIKNELKLEEESPLVSVNTTISPVSDQLPIV